MARLLLLTSLAVAAYSFTTLPLLDESGWLRLIMGVAGLILAAAAHRWRTRRLRRQWAPEASPNDRTEAGPADADEESTTPSSEPEHLPRLLRDKLRNSEGPITLGRTQARRLAAVAERLRRLVDRLTGPASAPRDRPERPRAPAWAADPAEESGTNTLWARGADEYCDFVDELVETARARLDDPDFDVGALAAEMGLSRRQLTRRTKAAVDAPPGAVMRRLRLDRAKDLLRKGAQTVSEVAYATGFRSPSSFSQSFHKEVGCPPTEYADKHAG
jgi:AraC-like DNA-binding protein